MLAKELHPISTHPRSLACRLEKFIIIVAVAAVIMVQTVGFANAEDVPELQRLNPVPELIFDDSEASTTEATAYRITGHIDILDMKKNQIVVDDRLEFLAPEVRLYTEEGYEASPSQFQEGVRVGYQLGTDGKITALWLLGRN